MCRNPLGDRRHMDGKVLLLRFLHGTLSRWKGSQLLLFEAEHQVCPQLILVKLQLGDIFAMFVSGCYCVCARK